MDNEIQSTRVIQIFENLGYEVLDTAIGQAVVFDPINAFVFSLITGSTYLDDDYFPFTVKGLTKLFNSVFSTQPVWGLMDGESLGFTPKNISLTRPFIFDGPKYLVPVDLKSEGMARDWLENSRKAVPNPEHYLLLRIETWKNGNGMEPLLEYLACHCFRDWGYMVETQVPLSATTGSPDFLAIHDKNLVASLNEHFGRRTHGLHLIELAMLFISHLADSSWPTGLVDSPPARPQTIVGEAKVGGSDPQTQLRKYMSTSYFSQQLALLDNRPQPSKAHLPALYVSLNDRIILNNIDRPSNNHDKSKMRDYLDWYQFVSKCYLLANFDAENIVSLAHQHNLPTPNSVATSIIELAQLIDTEKIIKYLPAIL
jgi:hypothetical protein